MSHKCPKAGCDKQIPAHMLACRPHWYSVPKWIRDEVWRTWNNGASAGSAAHTAALQAAIRAMNRRA